MIDITISLNIKCYKNLQHMYMRYYIAYWVLRLARVHQKNNFIFL